jgi:hypothetical protein
MFHLCLTPSFPEPPRMLLTKAAATRALDRV